MACSAVKIHKGFRRSVCSAEQRSQTIFLWDDFFFRFTRTISITVGSGQLLCTSGVRRLTMSCRGLPQIIPVPPHPVPFSSAAGWMCSNGADRPIPIMVPPFGGCGDQHRSWRAEGYHSEKNPAGYQDTFRHIAWVGRLFIFCLFSLCSQSVKIAMLYLICK